MAREAPGQTWRAKRRNQQVDLAYEHAPLAHSRHRCAVLGAMIKHVPFCSKVHVRAKSVRVKLSCSTGIAQPRDAHMFSPVAQARLDTKSWEHRNDHCGDATAWSSQKRSARRTERTALTCPRTSHPRIVRLSTPDCHSQTRRRMERSTGVEHCVCMFSTSCVLQSGGQTTPVHTVACQTMVVAAPDQLHHTCQSLRGGTATRLVSPFLPPRCRVL